MAIYNDLTPRNLRSGTLTIGSKADCFAYIRISEKTVKELSFKLISRANDSEMVPFPFKSFTEYFESSGHIPIDRSKVFSDVMATEEVLRLNGKTVEIICSSIEETTSTLCETVEKVWRCIVKCPTLDQLHKDPEKDKLYFTISLKAKASTSSETSRSLLSLTNALLKSYEIEQLIDIKSEEILVDSLKKCTSKQINSSHILSAHVHGYFRLVDMFIRICGYEKKEHKAFTSVLDKSRIVCILSKQAPLEEEITEDDKAELLKGMTRLQSPSDFSQRSVIGYGLIYSFKEKPVENESNLLSLSALSDILTLDNLTYLLKNIKNESELEHELRKVISFITITSEHIKLSEQIGQRRVAVMLSTELTRRSKAAVDKVKIKFPDSISNAKDEFEALDFVFDDKGECRIKVNSSHLQEALDKGYNILADMLRPIIEKSKTEVLI